MDAIKIGMRFKNNSMDCEVIQFAQTAKSNVALLFCHGDGLYITIRNLSLWNGGYTWDWGHYFKDKQEALNDYQTRKKDL